MSTQTTVKDLHISAMQRYAHAALKDGLDIPTVESLASLANYGRHQSNVERDFHRTISCIYDCQFPLYYTSIEIYDSDDGQTKLISVPMLLASTVLHEIHKKTMKVYGIL